MYKFVLMVLFSLCIALNYSVTLLITSINFVAFKKKLLYFSADYILELLVELLGRTDAQAPF